MDTVKKSALKKLEKAKKIIEAYERFEGDVTYAMDKVGWNNTRIEEAYGELQKTLKKIDE